MGKVAEHHYIPRVYLKLFRDIKSDGFFSLDNIRTPHISLNDKVNLKRYCSVENLNLKQFYLPIGINYSGFFVRYKDYAFVEDSYGKLESEFGRLTKRYRNVNWQGMKCDVMEEMPIIHFMPFVQHKLRSESFVHRWMIVQYLRSRVFRKFSLSLNREYEDMVSAHVACLSSDLWFMDNPRWVSYVQFDAEGRFISSDNPVYLTTKNNEDALRFIASKNFVIEYFIPSNILGIDLGNSLTKDVESINKINSETYNHAFNTVFASRRDILEKFKLL